MTPFRMATFQAESDQDAIGHPEIMGGKGTYQQESVLLNTAALMGSNPPAEDASVRNIFRHVLGRGHSVLPQALAFPFWVRLRQSSLYGTLGDRPLRRRVFPRSQLPSSEGRSQGRTTFL